MSLSVRRWFAVSLVVLLAALAPLVLAVSSKPADARPESADSGTTISSGGGERLSAAARALMTGSGPEAEAQAAERYWTPERMQPARPADQRLSTDHITGVGTTCIRPGIQGQDIAVRGMDGCQLGGHR